MTRCDYDAVFYRVFCVTLLAVAFTFTLILTNVFIDIDGLLSKKNDKHNVVTVNEVISEDFTVGPAYSDDANYEDTEDSYRTKRSIDTLLKTPKLKNILTKRLENLLKSLDADDTTTNSQDKDEIKDMNRYIEALVEHKEEEQKLRRQEDKDIVYLTVHNILLQGIIGHMDLKDIYNRIELMMLKLINRKEDLEANSKPEMKTNRKIFVIEENLHKDTKKNTFLPENNGTVKNDTGKENFDKLARSSLIERRSPLDRTSNFIDPKLIIKTVIDINTIGKERNETIIKDNVEGLLELRYNGKLLKFSQPQTDSNFNLMKEMKFIPKKLSKLNNDFTERPKETTTDIYDFKNIPKENLSRFVAEFFKNFSKDKKELEQLKRNVERKRMKRHVKVKFLQENKHYLSEKEKVSTNTATKKKDDELYVEIETHFDSKGMKGEKRKNLIRHLIDKIQKAIHSGEKKELLEINNTTNKNKIHAHLHVRKRTQDPLKELERKFPSAVNSVIHRQLNPITVSKTLTSQKRFPKAKDKSGEAWKKEYVGPAFLTGTKSINSAEMSEVNIDYTRVLDDNGIPQRLQKPLNTDMSEETMNANSIYDLGNMKFFIKDIDGSGFSIGYNQYTDDPPDSETMKLFTGLESIIKAYQQNYGDETSGENSDVIVEDSDAVQQISDKNDHIILRRSIREKNDYHANEYKIIYDRQFMPYNSYKDIYDRKESVKDIELNKSKQIFKNSPIVIDENIFEKYLKPAEIFGLADLLQRKKRSINVKKISNIKNKIKLNRYLNTNAMANKRFFVNKRNKRQINKIRIIASDYPQKDTAYENIFVVSDENLFANRATIKEVSLPEEEPEKFEEQDYIPYQAEESDYPIYKIFDSKYRHNPLMLKYPHILMEEIAQSKEELDPNDILLFNKIPALSNIRETNTDKSLNHYNNLQDSNLAKNSEQVPSVIDGLEKPKPNYKVTVKITPKNTTGLNGGFKEIHTSINKSFNKNGLMYSSLVNVSEISKVTKITKNNGTEEIQEPSDEILATKIKNQQEKINLLLRQHQKHIDEQLLRLSEEKRNLNSILREENNTIVLRSTNIAETSNLHKNCNLSSDLNKLGKTSDTKNPSTSTTTTTSTLQTTPTTPQVITSKISDNLKKSILRKIEKNEHLTNTILNKIDKNTEVLQSFLNKLTDKIDIHISQRETNKGDVTTDKLVTKFNVNSVPINWRNPPALPLPFDNNMNLAKNESNVSRSFHYGYQQSLMSQKNNAPLTSIGYRPPVNTNLLHT